MHFKLNERQGKYIRIKNTTSLIKILTNNKSLIKNISKSQIPDLVDESTFYR